jgi:hypothetical protein
VTSETLTVVVRHDPNPDCETCGGEGLFVDGELEEQVDCPCAEDQYRRPTPADLAAHVAALPAEERVAVLVALVGTCGWSADDEESESGLWVSACGAAWEFLDGGPVENGMKHCPKCGASVLAEVPRG